MKEKFCNLHPKTVFTAAVFLANLIYVLLYPLYYVLVLEKYSGYASVLYYVMQTYTACFEFATVAAIFVIMKKKGVRASLPYTAIAAAMRLMPNLFASFIQNSGFGYGIVVAIIESFGILIQSAAIYVIFTIIMYALAKKYGDAENLLPKYFSVKSGTEKGCMLVLALTLIYRIAFQIPGTVETVRGKLGIIFYSDMIDIFLSYVFIILSVLIAYAVLILTLRLLIGKWSVGKTE